MWETYKVEEFYTLQFLEAKLKIWLDCPIPTKLDLVTIENKLGKKHELRQSDDPGRYLCNYIYFKSSYDLSLKN
jgi:hypothetical protein